MHQGRNQKKILSDKKLIYTFNYFLFNLLIMYFFLQNVLIQESETFRKNLEESLHDKVYGGLHFAMFLFHADECFVVK